MSNAIFWFRNDLRLTDNTGLISAISENDAILPVYILDNTKTNPWPPGQASLWFLKQSLISLSEDIKKCHSQLMVLQGDPQDILIELAKKYNIQSIYWNRCYEPALIERDKKIKKTLKEQGFNTISHNSFLLIEPPFVKNQSGDYYKVYTPFKNKILPLLEHISTEKKVQKIKTIPFEKQEPFDSWSIWPTHTWTKKLEKYHSPSEKSANKILNNFIKNKINDYQAQRDFPAKYGVSLLSPYLHFGQLGPRQVLKAILANKDSNSSSSQTYISQLIWREFSYYLLYYFPSLPHFNFNAKFNTFQWKKNKSHLELWQKGKTGYPIVDAGMRELWETGIMHNRVRMIVASFLTKDLLIHWDDGQKWFWDTLVDADLANNAGGWQWVAGSGADAQPYFRIFNPITQSAKFDPQGDYIRKWLPELEKLPNKMIHSPWEQTEETLKTYGVALGKTYPFPIVDHKTAREEALRLYQLL